MTSRKRPGPQPPRGENIPGAAQQEQADDADQTASSERPTPATGVGPEDPCYLDLRYFPDPKPGQTWVKARFEQVAAVKAQLAGVRQCHIKDDNGSAGCGARCEESANQEPASSRAKVLVAIDECKVTVCDAFPGLIPARPYCADDYAQGIYMRRRDRALWYRHVQFNRKNSVDWLCFDIDREEAYRAWEDAGLPAPSIISINPANGHGLFSYLLQKPVHRFPTSRLEPLSWVADIQRGYMRRFGADPSFNGVVLKNPLHPHWRTTWPAVKSYALEDLDCALDPQDKKPPVRAAQEIGEGRNVLIFETARKTLYRESVGLLDNPKTISDRAQELAAEINRSFAQPLSMREVASIARSISKWIIRNFSAERFSKIQRSRARKRWAGHVSAESAKPWQAQGISRATYYRRKKSVVGQ